MHHILLRRLTTIGALALTVLSACGRSVESPLSPGGATLAPQSTAAPTSTTRLVISEVMADPATISDANGEWFELHNPGASTVSLTGFQIASANDASVTITGAVSIPAGGYAVFAKNADNAANGGVNAVFSFGAMNLANNATDWLLIRDNVGALVDSVSWGATPPTGASRAKRAMVIDCTPFNDARAWGTSTTNYVATNRGTPGLANDVSDYSAPDLCGGGYRARR